MTLNLPPTFELRSHVNVIRRSFRFALRVCVRACVHHTCLPARLPVFLAACPLGRPELSESQAA